MAEGVGIEGGERVLSRGGSGARRPRWAGIIRVQNRPVEKAVDGRRRTGEIMGFPFERASTPNATLPNKSG